MNVRSDLDVASRTLQSQHQRLRDGLEAMRRNLRQLVAPDEQSAQLLPRLTPRLDTMRDTLNADWLRWLPTEQLRQTPGVAALIPQLARGESLDGLDIVPSLTLRQSKDRAMGSDEFDFEPSLDTLLAALLSASSITRVTTLVSVKRMVLRYRTESFS